MERKYIFTRYENEMLFVNFNIRSHLNNKNRKLGPNIVPAMGQVMYRYTRNRYCARVVPMFDRDIL